MFPPLVDGVAEDQDDHGRSDAGVLADFGLMFFEERKPVFDFQGELVSF